MADMLHLEIITPSKEMLSTQTPWVTLPGELGEMAILPEHIPLVTTLDSGVLQYEQHNVVRRVAVHYGYAQVRGDRVTVLSEMAESAEDIDRARASAAERKARQTLDGMRGGPEGSDHPHDKWDSKLKRAMIRVRAAG